MTRQHDADLCERIRALEERVKELEADLELHRFGSPHVYPAYPTWYPWWPNQPLPWTVWSVGTGDTITNGSISVSNTTNALGTQISYTAES